MNIRPIKEYVLVLRDEPKTVTDGGIHLPDNAQDIAKTGHVKAIGKDTKEVDVGDRVMFIWSAGFDIKADGVEYNTLLLMKESDILAVIDESNIELPKREY